MITQGSNLPLYFSNLPVALESIDDISAGIYTQKDGKELKHWSKEDLTITENGILAPLTQAESMELPADFCYVELKFTDTSGMILPGVRVMIHVSRRDDKTSLFGEQPQTLRYVDIDCSKVLTDAGAVVGASAYELAVKYGFTGTAEEWLDSLRYDHSEEFAAFVNQIVESTRTAQEAAQASVNAAIAAEDAKNDAEKAAGNISSSESNAKASEEKALKASADAVAAKEEIQASADQIGKNATDIGELMSDLGQLSEEIANLPGTSDEQVQNAVNNYMANNPIEESDPTVPDWAKQPQKPTYTASEVGAEAAGTAVAKVSEHNAASNAHNDIRELISGLTQRLNALADSDDTTLDQMSEVVAYIKSNKSLIDAITTSKVSVTDIIDNLTTNVSNKPLSAAQGVALKALIDAITTVELDETLTDNTKAAPAGMVGELKKDLADLQTAKMELYSIKTVMDSVATPHTQYFLGEQTAVDIVLPDTADVGQIISVSWYNGDTAATLSITGTMLDFDYTPGNNSRSEINALWDGINWSILGTEIAVPVKEVMLNE